MKIASLGIAVALGAAPAVAHAQVSVSGGISFNVGAAPGDAVGSVDVFYDQLSPYGVWVNDPVVGEAFIPDEDNYTPYTNGHWEMTDVGFVWVSSEPFAWATSHYGRWFYSDDYGRWVWMPDTTWGPNWVDWYESGDSFGWAPLAPDIVVSAGYSTPDWAYHFCPSDRILATDVTRYYVPRERVEVIRRDARPITHREQGRDHQVIVGPAPERLQAHRITARPHKADIKTVGRMNAGDLRAAEQRAETRKPQLERQNQQRLEQHAQIKKAVEVRATKAPANRPEMNRTQPARPENRTQPSQPNRADENRTQPNRADENRTQPARPEPRGVTPGATDRGDNNRARPDRANERGDENRATTPRPDENRPRPDDNRARPEPKATPVPPTEDRTPNRPEPKAAPAPRPEPQVNRPEPTPRPEPQRAEPRPEPQREPRETRPEPQRPEPQHAAPSRPEPQTTRPEPTPRAEPKGHAEGHGDKRKNEH